MSRLCEVANPAGMLPGLAHIDCGRERRRE